MNLSEYVKKMYHLDRDKEGRFLKHDKGDLIKND